MANDTTQVYRMVPLLANGRVRRTMQAGPMRVILGELEDYIIISLPPDASLASAQQIADTVEKAHDRPVLVVAHNTAYLAVEKLSDTQRRAVLKQVEVAPATKD
ncbi:MAG: hypothetical protein EOO40_00575 [Deltaproteobacteria bacterium]|nr:MAG: hypothetical protein EOO40_00575 [Deltaproteobacteria bacterium]